MKAKKKPCKGITAETKGFGCGKETYHRVHGLGKMCGCYSNWLLNTEAGRLKMEKAQLKASKPRRELEEAEKEIKNRKNLTTLIKSVVSVFHEYVRERDKGKPCIACGTEWKKDFHASHFFKAELYSSLRLNEYNVHSGCIECNIRKEGNINQYSQNLPFRIGRENYEKLINLAAEDKMSGHRWDREELIETRKYYKEKLKILRNGGLEKN